MHKNTLGALFLKQLVRHIFINFTALAVLIKIAVSMAQFSFRIAKYTI